MTLSWTSSAQDDDLCDEAFARAMAGSDAVADEWLLCLLKLRRPEAYAGPGEDADTVM